MRRKMKVDLSPIFISHILKHFRISKSEIDNFEYRHIFRFGYKVVTIDRINAMVIYDFSNDVAIQCSQIYLRETGIYFFFEKQCFYFNYNDLDFYMMCKIIKEISNIIFKLKIDNKLNGLIYNKKIQQGSGLNYYDKISLEGPNYEKNKIKEY